jgi:hypothetical protein
LLISANGTASVRSTESTSSNGASWDCWMFGPPTVIVLVICGAALVAPASNHGSTTVYGVFAA